MCHLALGLVFVYWMSRTPQAASCSSRVVCQRIARAAVATPELPAYNIFIQSMPARSAWKTRAISVRYDGVRVTSLPTARTNLINAVVAKQPAPVIKSTAALLAKSLQGLLKKSSLLYGVVCFSTYLRRDENQHGYAQMQRRLVRMRGQQTQPFTFWIRLLIFLHRRSKL